ncbi:MAG: phenylacetate--CoA ligase family protein [Gemmataceae bacterium]
MPFFQLRQSPVNEWPRLPPAAVNPVWALYRELDDTQWLPPEEIERQQLRQLRLLLTHCRQYIPYYQRLFAEAGIVPEQIQDMADWRCLPRLTREAYQANFAELTARQLPAGSRKTNDSFTSGTNGVPVQVMQTNDVNQWWMACLLRDLEWCGMDPRGTLAAIRLLATSREEFERRRGGATAPYWHKFLHTFLETGTVHTMDIHEEPRDQLRWLRKVRPDYLLSLPSNLDFLASLIRQEGERLPNLRVIQAVGETLTQDMKEHIESAFAAPVKNLYSTTETGYIASPCPEGHGLHVHAENVLVEILDDQDQPCRPGQTGRVVLTTLRNFLAPFLRYEILDDATLAPGPCPCGRGLPLLTNVAGRRHPMLRLPGGRRKIITGLYLGLRQIGGCHQFQIVQRAEDHVIVRLVPDQTWSADHPTRIRALVREHCETPMRVDVDLLERIELPRSGKLKIALIEMDELA